MRKSAHRVSSHSSSLLCYGLLIVVWWEIYYILHFVFFYVIWCHILCSYILYFVFFLDALLPLQTMQWLVLGIKWFLNVLRLCQMCHLLSQIASDCLITVPTLSTVSTVSTLSTLLTSHLERYQGITRGLRGSQGISWNSEYTVKMWFAKIVKICKNVKSANLAHLLGPIFVLFFF